MRRVKNHWLTLHWPPLRMEAEEPGYHPNGILLREGHEAAGDDLEVGDLVMIYQTFRGKAELNRGPRIQGVKGIVNISRVVTHLYEWNEVWTYADGDDNWRLRADTEAIEHNGFVPYAQVIDALGLGHIRGIGRGHSGLRLLTRQEFTNLRRIFRNNQR